MVPGILSLNRTYEAYRIGFRVADTAGENAFGCSLLGLLSRGWLLGRIGVQFSLWLHGITCRRSYRQFCGRPV